ncbi:MAG: glycosyltransferase [Pseudomonadota bacterium]|nr:glycosyltransferase [Pseudomonadota bacterium]
MTSAASPRWSIVVPYYNELAFIERTIACAVAQVGTSFRLVLVDNASDDGSEALCRTVLKAYPHIDVRYVFEVRPGPSRALEAGLAHVDTPLVALWNADTWYPDDYLARADAIMNSDEGVVAAMALDLYRAPHSAIGIVRRYYSAFIWHLWPRQTHTGTFGQCFRTEILRAAGGPRSEGWPYVLDDHELMQRVFKIGASRYDVDFWCMPSARRQHSVHVRWSLFERLMYHFTPFALKDWFFYQFLGPRFEARGMRNANLRERDWASADTSPAPAPDLIFDAVR